MNRKDTTRKQLDIPKHALKIIKKLAEDSGTDSKKYMQNLIISHVLMQK